MSSPVAGAYTAEETQRGLRLGVAEGSFYFAAFTLASGAILAALVFATGMGDFEYGLLAALPFLAQLLQIPYVAVLRRVHRRKLLAVAFSSASRFSLIGVATALVLAPPEWVRPAIVLSFLSFSVFGALSAGAWLWWMRDLVPKERLGTYFGERAAALVLFSAPVLFGAGYFIDAQRAAGGPEGERLALAILYTLATIFGLMSSTVLSMMPHRPPKDDPRSVALRDSLTIPFEDRNFRWLLAWFALWGFGATLTVPFFPVFLLTDIGLPISLVTGLLLVGLVTNVVFFHLWGRLSDRYGNKPVLAVVIPVLGAALLLTTLVPEHPALFAYAMIVLIQILIAIAVAGADLTAWNLVFKLAEGPNAPSFLAAGSLVRALSTGVGPIAGGIAAGFVAAGKFEFILPLGPAGELPVFTLAHLTIVFVIGAAFVLASSVPLARVKETGEAPRSELLRALRTAAASETLLPGVRQFATATTVAVRFIVSADDRARASLDSGRRILAAAAESSGESLEGGVPPPPGQP